MNVFLWVLAGFLAVAFAGVGVMKLTRSREQLAASGLHWTEDFSESTIEAIGALEVLAAVGLVLPGITGIAPILVPLAATGLAILMVGGSVVHARRREVQGVVSNVVLFIPAVVVAWGRFGPYAF